MRIEPGNYTGKILGAEVGQSRTGAPLISIKFDIGGQSRSVDMYLTDSAYEYTEQKLTGLGFNGDFQTPAFEKSEAHLFCRHEEYEGKTRERWDVSWVSKKEPAPVSTVKQLNARWRARTGMKAPASAGPASSRDVCWKLLCESLGDNAGAWDSTSDRWFEILDKTFPGRADETLTGADWHVVHEEIEGQRSKDVPF